MRTHAPEMIDSTAQDTFRRPRFNFDNFHAVFGFKVSLYYRFNSKPPISQGDIAGLTENMRRNCKLWSMHTN